MTQIVRAAVRVEGIVQGVGFRPFVYSLASRLGLAGLVGNDVDGVFAEVEGDPAAVREFLDALGRDAPPLARVERVTATTVAALRARKHRADKPFAILAADLPSARRLCLVDDAAASLLESQARSIVALPRLPDADVAALVAPGNRQLGIMLPYTRCTTCWSH